GHGLHGLTHGQPSSESIFDSNNQHPPPQRVCRDPGPAVSCALCGGHAMPKIIDGNKIAKEIQGEIAKEVTALKKKGVVPGLAVVLVGDDPASQVYVRMK